MRKESMGRNKGFFNKSILKDFKGDPVVPKNEGQEEMLNAIFNNRITFTLGPAGTGKTFIAMCAGLRLLQSKEVEKIVLTRPAVESSKSMGYIPGDTKEKYEPFLKPFFEAMDILLPKEKSHKLIETGKISIETLNHMRGTNQDSFLILDEAQNCTLPELQMVLTRLTGSGRFVINGDPMQKDDIGKSRSGLERAVNILDGIPGIDCVYMQEEDIVRDPLVKEIILAFRGNPV